MRKLFEPFRRFPMLLWSIIIALSVIIDQVSKVIVVTCMELYESIVIIPKLFSFTHIRNFGAAWGMFSESRWVFIAATSIALVILPIILYRCRRMHTLFSVSLSLIIGGAAGNMIDRVFLGYVVDFLEFTFIDFPVFNIADVCIVIGTILMALYILFFDKNLFLDKKKETISKKEKETEHDGTSPNEN